MYINPTVIRKFLKENQKKPGKELLYALDKRVEYLLVKAVGRSKKKIVKALDLY